MYTQKFQKDPMIRNVKKNQHLWIGLYTSETSNIGHPY